MKILIICSKSFYPEVQNIYIKLKEMGHEAVLPLEFDTPESEEIAWKKWEHHILKGRLLRESRALIKTVDAVLALNLTKNNRENYVGWCTFLELYEAFMEGKKIYLYNPIPQGMLFDEISGFRPVILDQDLSKITI